jgi:hypothetical protein
VSNQPELDEHDVEPLCTLTIKIGTKPDPNDPEEYIIHSAMSVERHDKDVPGAVALAACITSAETSAQQLRGTFREMYDVDDSEINVEVIRSSGTTIKAEGETFTLKDQQ